MNKAVHFLRITGLIEAVSFMVLVSIAIPLKYIWHMPMAVRVVGMIHGILFIMFCVALVRATRAARCPLSRGALVFVAALVPFGPFLIDRRMREWEAMG